jgi:photosystem II stability/assembly factor-like uncharacterized protein
MSTHRRSPWLGLLAIAGVLAAGAARAGVNTWTGSSPAVPGRPAVAMATDPRDPYVVYAAFAPGELYRSADGGRTWTRLAGFDAIYSLLVHPAAPDTLYIGAAQDTTVGSNGYVNVLKSVDRGATWTRVPMSNFYEFTLTLVGSATDPGTVYAGSGSRLFRTTDGGAHWLPTGNLSAAISSLVIHPTDPSKLYVAMDGDGYYYPFGAFAESTNTGGNWTYAANVGTLDQVCVALDTANPSTLFLGLAATRITAESGVRRSTDGGATWSHSESGLPAGAQVESLAIDPSNTTTLYAGTHDGIYRSRDSGATWLPFSKALANVDVGSIALSSDGRSLHASTERGAYDYEIAEGAIDVAATGPGATGVLGWRADGLSVQTLSGGGGWSATPFEGPVAAWNAVAAASSGNGKTAVLWQAGDGRWAIELVGPAGRESAYVFAAVNGWMPADVSIGADGRTHLLVTSVQGGMYVLSIDASGSAHPPTVYASAGGWSAVALADAADGGTWVLWRNTDGRSAVSIHRDGVMATSFKWDAGGDGAVADIAVGADGRARILVAGAAGTAHVWTIGADGTRASGGALSIDGLSPRRIAGASDGTLRLLWADRDGHGSVAVLDATGAVVATHEVPAP